MILFEYLWFYGTVCVLSMTLTNLQIPNTVKATLHIALQFTRM